MEQELIDAMKAALSDGSHQGVATLIARAIYAEGMGAEIEVNDDEPDALDPTSECLWVVSDRSLMIQGQEVASWTRCARGGWGEAGRQCSDDEWCVEEDTMGGDSLPEHIAAVLDVLGLDDEIPDVPEPPRATDTHEPDDAGEYCVYWETVGDDAHVVARYPTLAAARAVCDQHNREFSARNPSGGGTTYLCGYGVRQLIDDGWRPVEDGE